MLKMSWQSQIKEKRNIKILIKVNPQEYNRILDNANKMNYTISGYLRAAGMATVKPIELEIPNGNKKK